MKSLKEFVESKNNGKEIAKEIIQAFFGAEPKKLSDEGRKCETEEDINKLIEEMELFYVHQENSQDPYDDSDIDTIHNELVNWVKTHNK